MTNKEQHFHKRHPIISGVTVCIIGGIIVVIIGKYFLTNPSQFNYTSYIYNNQVINDYTLSNKSNWFSSYGQALIKAQNGEINSVMVIEGQGRVTQLPDKTWAILFNIPSDQDLKFRIASGSVATVGLTINMDSSFFGRFEKNFKPNDYSK
ncbi:MAG TPA: hypothetical protein VMT12_10895 [Syntrophales bacterium]|nr:hypothetical protein [Syntrophales bacterium]